MTHVRSATLLVLLAFAPGCPQAPEKPPPGPQPTQTPATAATAEPWLYAPALRASVPPDVATAPVFELADGRRGRAQIGVAAASAGAGPRLEVWEFDQNNPRERLERVGEPRELVALAPGGDRTQLDAVRAAIARPGNEFVRVRGLEGAPEAIVAEIVRLAAVVRDDAAEPARRAEALAMLTRALDDHLLFTDNRLPDLLAALAEGGALEVAAREPIGERRVALTLKGPPHRLVFARSGDRWVISEATLARPHSASAAPAADPSPTAP